MNIEYMNTHFIVMLTAQNEYNNNENTQKNQPNKALITARNHPAEQNKNISVARVQHKPHRIRYNIGRRVNRRREKKENCLQLFKVDTNKARTMPKHYNLLY